MNHFHPRRGGKSSSEKSFFLCFKEKVKFHQGKNISFIDFSRLLNKHYRACRHFYALLHLRPFSGPKIFSFALLLLRALLQSSFASSLLAGEIFYCSVCISARIYNLIMIRYLLRSCRGVFFFF